MTLPAATPMLTDLYQLTMAYGYWKLGRGERESVFHLHYRKNPFMGGYSITCGLEAVAELLERFQFATDDLEYLRSLEGNDGKPLFEPAFISYLRDLKFTCDIDAMPEGTVSFAGEPLLRLQGPILQAQILETPLLNLINFQTLIATKAARICQAARGEPVIEFGLRRAQGVDGSLSASRAAYVGGCTATSNVLAGKLYGIPVKGTHAHSWVMSFPDEPESFEAYARALPNNCVFLVDTYNTLQGVRNAVEVGKELRKRGHEMAGIRLDSGDLAYLSIEARKILDAAGFNRVTIVASNDLDEHIITSLKDQGATINVWGVGTKLATAYDQPALGGVYKLAALRNDAGEWEYKVKLSEQAVKVSTPGIQQVRRFRDAGGFVADMIYHTGHTIREAPMLIDPKDMTRRKAITAGTAYEDLLVPAFRAGKRVLPREPLTKAKDRARDQLERFHPGIRRFANPHEYPVGLEAQLYELKTELILRARAVK